MYSERIKIVYCKGMLPRLTPQPVHRWCCVTHCCCLFRCAGQLARGGVVPERIMLAVATSAVPCLIQDSRRQGYSPAAVQWCRQRCTQCLTGAFCSQLSRLSPSTSMSQPGHPCCHIWLQCKSLRGARRCQVPTQHRLTLNGTVLGPQERRMQLYCPQCRTAGSPDLLTTGPCSARMKREVPHCL